jgi:hypothetical protein
MLKTFIEVVTIIQLNRKEKSQKINIKRIVKVRKFSEKNKTLFYSLRLES